MITWPLTGNIITGDPVWLGSPLLNHGFQYYEGYPAILTIIDIGQQIFMLALGFVAYLAFTSRREEKGVGTAWKLGIIRVAILFGLVFLADGIIGGLVLGDGDIPWNEVLYYGTLANLAVGSFAAYLGTYLIPKDADKRIFLSIGIMVVHAILYELPIFDHYNTSGGLIFPFNAFNHSAIAIAGTCFSQWYKIDPNDPSVGFKKRILPFSTISIFAFYCFDWVQPAEHHDATTSLALLAIAASGFLIAVFYGFEKMNFKFPLLSEMGRNMLILFVLSWIFGDIYVGLMLDMLGRTFLVANPLLTMLLVGIVPIALEALIAILLAKKDLIIKI